MFVKVESGVVVDQRVLLEHADPGGAVCRADDWTMEAYADFSAILSRDNFPCLFGRNSLKRETLKFLFVRGADELVAGVLAYTAFVKATPLAERLYTPLVIIFEQTGFANLAEEHAFCWKQLKTLHLSDPAKKLL